MITYSMSVEEINKEIKGDVFYIDGILNGKDISMRAKARKVWSRTKTGNTLLDVMRVKTPRRKNNVWIIHSLLQGPFPVLHTEIFFEQLTKDGKIQVIMVAKPQNILFTHHSLSRMSERAGLGLKDAIIAIALTGCYTCDTYAYKGETTKAFPLNNKGLCFVKEEDTWVVVKTFVPYDMLYANQTELSDSNLEVTENYEKRKAYEIFSKETKNKYRCPQPA